MARWQPRAICIKSAAKSFPSSDDNDGSTAAVCGDSSGSCQCQQVLNVNKPRSANKSVKFLEIGGLKVQSLVDSGGDAKIITAERNDVKENIEFSGLGTAKVCSLGKAERELNLDKHCLCLMFYIVPKDAISYKVILGHLFYKTQPLFLKGVSECFGAKEW